MVGKPCCNKSLSIQLLLESMKGENSDNILFKTLPKLLLNYYQGSLGSTSKIILNIFKKVRQFLEKETDENLSKIIPMIFFNQINLETNSPNNILEIIKLRFRYIKNE